MEDREINKGLIIMGTILVLIALITLAVFGII